ncbi:hypothetical protein Rrhod_4183 [Rhodococcus rhodnii LMG 5362]|uniref:Uncharacterized protein n=1 Tax=Rhodococcus rhodnii LMG 5362 TaxID=1273125 RepID=R7WH34_9NOCA|nr:hypothetical protein Rrhod_4183 [Rhodococcus rhodnii LMG 5362]
MLLYLSLIVVRRRLAAPSPTGSPRSIARRAQGSCSHEMLP